MKSMVLLILMSLGAFVVTAQTQPSNKEREIKNANSEFEKVQNLINSGKFAFEANWAIPQGGSQINLIGNPNRLEVENDSTEGFFPYYGVVHRLTNYNGRGGINFKGPIKDNKMEINTTKRRTTLKFEVNEPAEWYNLVLTIGNLDNATLTVISSNRSTITYRGRVFSPNPEN